MLSRWLIAKGKKYLVSFLALALFFKIIGGACSIAPVLAQNAGPTSQGTPSPGSASTKTSSQTSTPSGEEALPALEGNQTNIKLQSIDFQDFPIVRGKFQIACPLCTPQEPIEAEMVKAVERDMEIQVSDLLPEYTGIHLALAINPTDYWLSHNDKWISPLDYTATALKKLNNRAETNGTDLFDVFSNPNFKKTGFTDGMSFNAAIADYIDTVKAKTWSSASLEAALKALIVDQSGREKVLIYASPIPDYARVAELNSLFNQAKLAGIRVHFWTNDPFNLVQRTSTGKTLLKNAEDTGGKVVLFEDLMPTLPDPIQLLKGSGYTYTFKYQSFLRETTKTQISVRVTYPGENPLSSNPLQAALTLAPAKIDFIAPPEVISFSPGSDGKTLEPDSAPLNISIDFPDQHPRNLVRSTLYVNGSVAQVNEKAPYGSFLLPLLQYKDKPQLELKAVLEDELKLKTETPVIKVTLEWPLAAETKTIADIFKNPLFWATSIILLLIMSVFLFFRWLRKKAKEPAADLETNEEQETSEDTPKPKLKLSHSGKEKYEESYEVKPILASFNRLDSDNQPTAGRPALIFNPVTLIGRDKTRCAIVFDDPSLDEVHAELRMEEDGSFILRDLNSAAGTWVDFKLLDEKPIQLHHKAILQLGDLRLRFISQDRVSPAKK